jgi:signal transduction histidine kinase
MKPTTRVMWQVNKYLWLCLLFIALFIPLAHAHGWLTVSIPVAYGVFGLGVLNAAARTYYGWKRGGFNDEKGWPFTLIDIALISAAVRITGGIHSELWLAFYVLLISESLFSTSLQNTILNVSMTAGYLAATWPDHSAPDYAATVLTRMFFLVVAGSFGLRLSGDRERRNKEVALLREQVAASDERARIAREVHDSLGHSLVSTILRLELCSRLIKKSPDEAEKLLKEEVPALRAAWNEGRNMVFHLRPWERDEAGIIASLRRHISRFAERTGIAVDFTADDESVQLNGDVEMALIRILQESLTNVAKHAQAGKVTIRIIRTGGNICCLIRDDGTGFIVEERADSFGLTAMRDRATQVGGKVTLESRPESGTTVEIVLPIKP